MTIGGGSRTSAQSQVLRPHHLTQGTSRILRAATPPHVSTVSSRAQQQQQQQKYQLSLSLPGWLDHTLLQLRLYLSHTHTLTVGLGKTALADRGWAARCLQLSPAPHCQWGCLARSLACVPSFSLPRSSTSLGSRRQTASLCSGHRLHWGRLALSGLRLHWAGLLRAPGSVHRAALGHWSGLRAPCTGLAAG